MQITLTKESNKQNLSTKQILKMGKLQNEIKIAKKITIICNSPTKNITNKKER